MNEKYEITLKPKTTFEAFVGEKSLGEFEINSEWEGFIKLTSKSDVIIAVFDADPIYRAFKNFTIKKQPEKVLVIMASPDLAEMISAEVRKAEEARQPEVVPNPQSFHPPAESKVKHEQ